MSVGFGSVTALTGIDLRVGPGEIVAISGEPGAGKTTLLRSVAGDQQLSSGEIRIDSKPLASTLRAVERQGVAVVWQDIMLCETLDIAGNLLLGQETSAQLLSDRRFYARAAEILSDLEIPITDTTRIARTLPSGQRGLLALAMALFRQPRLLLLDEPTAKLGAAESAVLERLVGRVKRSGVAVLLATRDIGLMFRIADRIAVLRNGRMVAQLRPVDSHPDDVAALLSGG